MREFTRFQFEHTVESEAVHPSPIRFVGQLLHNLYSRHMVQQLAMRDDHILADIGVTRDDIAHAAHVPITRDATDDLEQARQDHDANIVGAPLDFRKADGNHA